MTILRKIADTLAVVFHPAFLYFYAFTGYLMLSPNYFGNKATGFLAVLILTVVIPVAAVIYLAKDINLSNRKKRFLPLGVALLSYVIAYFYLRFDLTVDLSIWLLATIASTLVLLFFTLFSKVSMHANAYGVASFFMWLELYQTDSPLSPIAKVLIFTGWSIILLVLWQRLRSGAHTIAQVISGFLIGIGTALFTFLFYMASFASN